MKIAIGPRQRQHNSFLIGLLRKEKHRFGDFSRLIKFMDTFSVVHSFLSLILRKISANNHSRQKILDSDSPPILGNQNGLD